MIKAQWWDRDTILSSSQAIAEINRLMQDFTDASYVTLITINAIGVSEQEIEWKDWTCIEFSGLNRDQSISSFNYWFLI
jgi:hypothetical protein